MKSKSKKERGMLKTEHFSQAILSEVQKEVTDFFAQLPPLDPDPHGLEIRSKEIGLRLAAKLIEKAIAFYGNGHQGQSLPCLCSRGSISNVVPSL